MPQQRSALQKYLASIRGTGAVSEIALYKPFAQYILGDILGYPDNSLVVNERDVADVPDIKIYSAPRSRQNEGELWAVAEGKLDDRAVRDPVRRERIWKEQIVRYIRPETFHVILFAPETICVLAVTGEPRIEIQLQKNALAFSLRGRKTESAELTDKALKGLLDDISFETAQKAPQYEAFRRGDLKAGQIALGRDTVHLLEDVFQFGVRELRAVGEQMFDRLQTRHRQVHPEIEEVGGQIDIEIDERRRAALQSRLWRLRRKNRAVLRLFDEDYPEFCHDQSYSGTEERDFREIFVTNSVHVMLSRMFFIRLCEDLGLVHHRISNAGIGHWRKLIEDIAPLYQDLIVLACKGVQPIYERLFEENVFDWMEDLNGELSGILEKILFRLNAFSFSKVDRDLLGTIYQSFRPRAERKRLGEYYTPVEVVDFILSEVGFAADPGAAQKRLLDPSCGSFTFGVRAAARLLDKSPHLSPAHRLELVERSVSGYDINSFSTFLAHLSMLYSLLDQYLAAKTQAPKYKLHGFSIERLNTLTTGIELASERLGRDDSGFDYIVGNPPFVRNERLPEADRKELAARYPDVSRGNTDLSVFFLYACAKWLLKNDGRLGMVAPIGLANSTSAAELRLRLAEQKLEALVSLEWMAKETFPDADTIPMLVFLRQGQASEKGRTIRLVHGLRSKAELARAATDADFHKQHTSVLPFARWRDLSPTGDWPLEVTGDDLPILEKLRKRPTWEKSNFAGAQYAVKLGQAGQNAVRAVDPETPRQASEVPLVKGNHTCAFYVSQGEELADLAAVSKLSGASIWRGNWRKFFEANSAKADQTGLGRYDYDGTKEIEAAPSDTNSVLVPNIYVRLTAGAANPLALCSNDSNSVVLPFQSSAAVVVALLNSCLMAYYSFLMMRSGILLRRRSHFYPRIILNLPLPSLSDAQKKKLHRLAGTCTDLSRQADELSDEALVFLRGMKKAAAREKLAFLGLGAVGVAHDTMLESDDLGEVDVKAKVLPIGDVKISAPDPEILILTHAAFLATESESLTLEQLQELSVPKEPQERRALAKEIASIAANLQRAQKQVLSNFAEIDEIAAEALGLTSQEMKIVRRRCAEFPLDVTVGRPRFVWSPDRKRQARRVYEDDRFKG
jgi:hypothetical protein